MTRHPAHGFPETPRPHFELPLSSEPKPPNQPDVWVLIGQRRKRGMPRLKVGIHVNEQLAEEGLGGEKFRLAVHNVLKLLPSFRGATLDQGGVDSQAETHQDVVWRTRRALVEILAPFQRTFEVRQENQIFEGPGLQCEQSPVVRQGLPTTAGHSQQKCHAGMGGGVAGLLFEDILVAGLRSRQLADVPIDLAQGELGEQSAARFIAGDRPIMLNGRVILLSTGCSFAGHQPAPRPQRIFWRDLQSQTFRRRKILQCQGPTGSSKQNL
jgi:hypothetical protein